MIMQIKNEPRINYLIRVLDEFMNNTVSGEQRIDFDGAECDGYCLASDIAAELNIDVDQVIYEYGT